MPDDTWDVRIPPQAEVDLRQIRKRDAKVYGAAKDAIENLRYHPYAGDDCSPPLAGTRRLHFWNDKYRLVWVVDAETRRVEVVAIGRKDPTFYERAAQRWHDLLR